MPDRALLPLHESNKGHRKNFAFMKKRHVIFCMAMALLAGCSSGDDLLAGQPAVESPDDENITHQDLMGDMPIEFATVNFGADVEVEESSYAPKRASINNEFTTAKGTMGIFCLSSKKIGAAATDDAILRSWSGNVGAKLNMLNIWQDNVKAHVKSTYGTEGKMHWDDPNTPHYYPKLEYFNYSFAAYHPYTDVIKKEKSIIYAYIPMDGDDDVMYAFAEGPRLDVSPSVDELAYGNSYYKGIIDAGQTVTDDHKPYFSFKHCTAKLKFTVKFKETSSVLSEHQFHVDSICINNVVNIIRLSLAKNSTGVAEAGSYSLVSNTDGLDDDIKTQLNNAGYNGHGTFWLRDNDGTSIGEKVGNNYKYIISSSAKTPVGDGIMIPPTSAATLKVQVFLRDEDGNLYTTISPISLNLPSGASRWEAGKEYTVNVSMTPPANYVEARGYLEDWDVETSEIDIEDED